MNDMYTTQWNPRSYLRTYYATTHVPDDSQAIYRFLHEQLALREVHNVTALEFGCGPTIWTAIPLTPHLAELHLADYLKTNLAEIERWLDAGDDAHDWSTYLRYALECEGLRQPSSADVLARADLLRQRITRLLPADILQDAPLGSETRTYDLVTSFFCIECAAPVVSDWERCLERLAGLVAPGGHLMVTSITGGDVYHVGDIRFPVAPLSESDFRRLLPRLGFDQETMTIKPVSIADWANEGFDAICLVAATKRK